MKGSRSYCAPPLSLILLSDVRGLMAGRVGARGTILKVTRLHSSPSHGFSLGWESEF
jgi:hypothetical protein